MANKLLFGKQLTAYDDLDIDDLLSKLSPEEIEELNNDIDPDNSLLPPSQRCRDQTSKTSTGPLNREALIEWLENKAKNEKDWEKNMPFEKKTRGKIFNNKPTEMSLSKKELEEMGFDADLDTEFDDALTNATEEELVDLAAVLGFTGMLNQVQFNASLEDKPQSCGGFEGVAKAEPLRAFEEAPANDTDIEACIDKLEAGGADLKILNLNNLPGVTPQQIEKLCKALHNNKTLLELSCANIKLTNMLADDHLIPMLEKNNHLESLNVESNILSGDTIVRIFKAIDRDDSAITDIHMANQSQSVLGVRVEQEIIPLIRNNNRLRVLGADLETADCRIKIRDHLVANVDRYTRQRRKSGSQH